MTSPAGTDLRLGLEGRPAFALAGGTGPGRFGGARSGEAAIAPAPGSVPVALGDDVSLGGSVHAAIHLDGMVLRPTVVVDAAVLVADGVLRVSEVAD